MGSSDKEESTKEVITKNTYKRLVVNGQTKAIIEVAKSNGGDEGHVEKVNPKVICADPTQAKNHILTLPSCVYFTDSEIEKQLKGTAELQEQHDVLRPYSQPIRPKIAEIFRLFCDFDTRTFTYLNELEKKLTEKKAWPLPKGCDIVTHLDCWDDTFNPKDLLKGTTPSPYLEFRIEVITKYTESMRTMAKFVRNMTYLFHFCFNRPCFTVTDNDKMKNALVFANAFLNLLLERIDTYLFSLSHYYQSLNGSYHDASVYEQATMFIDSTFGELSNFFSKSGTISQFTSYPGYFFVISNEILLRYNPFAKAVKGKEFNETYIFDTAKDYTSLASAEEQNKIREKLNNNVTAASDNAYTTSKKTSAKSQALYIAYCSQDLSKLIDETEGAIAKYRNGIRWGEMFIMDRELDLLKDNARSVIDLLKAITGTLDEDTLDLCIQRTQVGVYSYILGLGLHIIMLETENSLDLLERYFKNQETFITEFRGYINELVNISAFGILNPEEGTKKLNEFSKKLEPFQKRGQELLNANKMAFAIAKTVIVMVIAALCSWGIGLLIGSMVTLAGGGGALLAASTFVGQVLAFTISSKVLEGIIDGKSIWFDSTGQFFMELGTTALMFLVFSAAGKIGQAIAKALGYKMAMFTVRFITQWMTMMVVTTPVFAFQLASRGQLTDKDEWIQFLTVQAIASALIAGIFAGAHNRMKQIEDMTKSWVGNTRTRWETIQFEQRRVIIENEMTLANNQWKAIDETFRKDFKPSLETTKKMRNALSSVVNQADKFLKAVELLNRDLRIFRKNCPVEKDAMLELISPEEVATAKFLMKESLHRLEIAKYTANQNTVLVQSIQKSIPGTKLVPLGTSTIYYQSSGFVTKLDQVKALTHSKGTTVRLVDVPRTSLFSQLPERYREGIVRVMAEWRVTHKDGVTKTGVTEVVIFDKKAEGIVRKELLTPRFEPHKRAASEDVKVTPAPVIRNLDMYIKMCKLPKADLIRYIKERPADMIWSHDELVAMKKDLHSKGGISYLKSQGVEKMLVFRIQQHDYGFAYKPAIFLGDPVSYIGYDNLITAKKAIGYNVESAESPDNVKNKVWFWEVDIDDVMEANWEKARDVVNEYLKWGKEWYDLTIAEQIKDPKVEPFDKNIRPKHIVDAYGGNIANVERMLKDLEKVMKMARDNGLLKSDYSSKLDKTELNDAWEKAIAERYPKDGMLKEMEEKAKAARIDKDEWAERMPELALGQVIGEIGFFDQFGGEGFGVTPLGQPGGMEWMLKYNPKNSFVIQTNLQELEKIPAEEVFKKGK